MQTPLYFRIERLKGETSPAGMYLVVNPDQNGNGRWCHHSHPDRTVLDAVVGDVIVHKRTPYRVLAVQPFGYKNDQWFKSVQDCNPA